MLYVLIRIASSSHLVKGADGQRTDTGELTTSSHETELRTTKTRTTVSSESYWRFKSILLAPNLQHRFTYCPQYIQYKQAQDKIFRRKRVSTGANFVHVYKEIWDNIMYNVILELSLPQAIIIGFCKQHRSRWDGSYDPSHLDLLCLAFSLSTLRINFFPSDNNLKKKFGTERVNICFH